MTKEYEYKRKRDDYEYEYKSKGKAPRMGHSQFSEYSPMPGIYIHKDYPEGREPWRIDPRDKLTCVWCGAELDSEDLLKLHEDEHFDD